MYYSWMFEPLPNLLFFSASSLNPNWAGFLLAVGIIAQIVSRIATKRKSFVYNWDVWFPEFAVEDVICYPFSAGKFSLKSVNLESKFWSFHLMQNKNKNIYVALASKMDSNHKNYAKWISDYLSSNIIIRIFFIWFDPL